MREGCKAGTKQGVKSSHMDVPNPARDGRVRFLSFRASFLARHPGSSFSVVSAAWRGGAEERISACEAPPSRREVEALLEGDVLLHPVALLASAADKDTLYYAAKHVDYSPRPGSSAAYLGVQSVSHSAPPRPGQEERKTYTTYGTVAEVRSLLLSFYPEEGRGRPLLDPHSYERVLRSRAGCSAVGAPSGSSVARRYLAGAVAPYLSSVLLDPREDVEVLLFRTGDPQEPALKEVRLKGGKMRPKPLREISSTELRLPPDDLDSPELVAYRRNVIALSLVATWADPEGSEDPDDFLVSRISSASTREADAYSRGDLIGALKFVLARLRRGYASL
jgi:hypothetical protein